MHILITGAAGMIGRKLTERLVADAVLGERVITKLTLVDIVAPARPAGFDGQVDCLAVDLANATVPAQLVATRPDVIFHFAAIVSGEAELDFDKGYLINLESTRLMFEAIRLAHQAEGYFPRVVFASSIAVFGAPFPDLIPDSFHPTPLTSYGTQKAICELLLADYTRRGSMDGIGIRLPTICIRPGAPNKAASGFFSSILREPLVGKEAVLPVPEPIRHWHASPRAAVGFMLHAATMDLACVGPRRNLCMPGLSATVAEQIEALRQIAGDKAVALIRREPDDLITRMCEGWATGFEASRAIALGFVAETSFEQIITAHIEDELGGSL
ncbi:MAG: SDR family oxidoreductase [Natronohydrobacter sp.]|nr:SDR family oxidoreductase [Natronohydrobacter sp.]